MYDLPMAMITSTKLTASQFAYPDSPDEAVPTPVVVRAPRISKVRFALAASLESAARAVAPRAVALRDSSGAR